MNFQADYNLKVGVDMSFLGTCCHATSLPHLINLSMTRRYMRCFAVSLVLSQSFVNGHLTSFRGCFVGNGLRSGAVRKGGVKF